MGSLIAAALARAQGFLLEPGVAEQAHAAAVREPLAAAAGVTVVVTGLSRRSGATTVARALAQALVVPGARTAHLISLGPPGSGESGRSPAGVATWDLPPALCDPREISDYGETLGRLAAGSGSAAVVWDVRADDVARSACLTEACDVLLCVADGAAEPALCALVCDMLAERYGRVLLIANRVRDDEVWASRCAVALPDSRLGALRIARGLTPGGQVAEAVAKVAALAEEPG